MINIAPQRHMSIMIALKSYMSASGGKKCSLSAAPLGHKSIMRDRRCAISAAEVFWNRHDSPTLGLIAFAFLRERELFYMAKANMANGLCDATSRNRVRWLRLSCHSATSPPRHRLVFSARANDMQTSLEEKLSFSFFSAHSLLPASAHSNTIINNVMFIHIKLQLNTQLLSLLLCGRSPLGGHFGSLFRSATRHKIIFADQHYPAIRRARNL